MQKQVLGLNQSEGSRRNVGKRSLPASQESMLKRLKQNSSQYKYVQEYHPTALQAPQSATNKQLQRTLAEDLEDIKRKRNSDYAEIKQLRVEVHKLDQYYRHF